MNLELVDSETKKMHQGIHATVYQQNVLSKWYPVQTEAIISWYIPVGGHDGFMFPRLAIQFTDEH